MKKQELEKINANPVEYVEALVATHEAEKAELIAAHEAEIAALKDATKKVLKVVPGTFTCELKNKWKFKDGHIKSRNANGEIVPSEELLKDKEYMQHLVDIESGIIEEV